MDLGLCELRLQKEIIEGRYKLYPELRKVRVRFVELSWQMALREDCSGPGSLHGCRVKQ